MPAVQAMVADSATPPESPYASPCESSSDVDVEAVAEGIAPRPADSAAYAAGAAPGLRHTHGAPAVQRGAARTAAQGPWPAAAAEQRVPACDAQAWPDVLRAAGGAAAAAAQARPAAAALACLSYLLCGRLAGMLPCAWACQTSARYPRRRLG